MDYVDSKCESKRMKLKIPTKIRSFANVIWIIFPFVVFTILQLLPHPNLQMTKFQDYELFF